MRVRDIVLFLVMVFITACATSGSNVGGMPNGTSLRTDYIRDTSMLTKGGTYEAYYRCDEDGTSNCRKVGELIVSNPTWFQQIFGGAAQIGSAALLADGLRGSGDNVNNTNQQSQRQRQSQTTRSMRRQWHGD